MNGTELLLVAVAGLCPLSFLLGIASVIILAVATGHIGKWHTKRLTGIPRHKYEEMVAEDLRDGWQIENSIVVMSDSEGWLFDIILKKWRLT